MEAHNIRLISDTDSSDPSKSSQNGVPQHVEVGSARDRWIEVRRTLMDGVSDGVFPGAVFLVARDGKVLFHEAVGHKSSKSPKGNDPVKMGIDSVFDIASLTIGLVTTSLIIRLVQEGRIFLTDRISRYLQGFGILGKAPITILHLLSHTSGLPHWHPFYEELIRENEGARMGILTSRGAREYVLNSLVRSQLKGEIGGKPTFGDLDPLLLGFVIEAACGVSLDKIAYQSIFQPLALRSTSYIDIVKVRHGGIHPIAEIIAPTEECPWRKRILWGEVHDDNAWAMGGIAGHSGVFSSSYDLHVFANELLKGLDGTSLFFNKEVLEVFLAPRVVGSSNTPMKLGWDSPSKENGMHEIGFSPKAFGYNGFTGCSLWVDPATSTEFILLTNRVHPSRSNKKIQSFRPELHRRALTVALSPSISAPSIQSSSDGETVSSIG